MIQVHTDWDSHEFESLETAISYLMMQTLFLKKMTFRKDYKMIFQCKEKRIEDTNKDYYFISVEYTAFNYRDELSVIIEAIHEFNKLQGERIVNLMTNR